MRRLQIASALAVLAVVAAAPGSLRARVAPGPSSPAMIQSLSEQGEGLAITQTEPGTGRAVFAAAKGQGILLPVGETDSAADRASVFVDLYGASFGLQGRAEVRLSRAPRRDGLGFEHVKFQQLHQGVPVAGGEFIVHMRGSRAMAANGRILDQLPTDVRPAILPETAVGVARQVIARYKQGQAAGARYSLPRLEIMSRAFLENQPGGQASLAWFIEAKGPSLRHFIWIDARTGGLLLQFSQLHTVQDRRVYDANFGPPPGTLARSEGDGPTDNPQVDAAYDLSGMVYDFFFNTFGRDSYNGLGAPLVSTVNVDPVAMNFSEATCAFWDGTRAVYSPDCASAEDVVGHELTHALTESEANLYYFVQSGALSESFADIFGETMDQLTQYGDDSPGAKWKVGEDLLTVTWPGPLRDMMNPNFFNQAGKISDTLFACSTFTDNGGVHTNSGVPNHAYALMVDGGTYNGYSITGIGLDKAARIQYRALTTYLTPSSGFLDDFSALNQSCVDLVGTAGITTADCSEVERALRAVEMHAPWGCTDTWMRDIPSICPAGGAPNYLFNDHFEAPITQWTMSSTTATQWGAQTFNVDEGAQAMLGPDPTGVRDHRIAMAANIGGAPLPAGARALFRHLPYFDGGFGGGAVEYSVNNGTSWVDANPLVDGGLRPDLFILDGSPLGRRLFSLAAYGYRTSRLTLASLVAQSVRLRFRVFGAVDIGHDVAMPGWFLDRIAVYTCPVAAGAPTITAQPVAQVVANGGSATFTVTATSSPPSTLRYQWLKNGTPITGATSSTLTLTNVQGNSQGYYSVIVSNDAGSATSDGASLRLDILSVVVGPVIVTQPISRTITAGQDVQFSADVQWVGLLTAMEWQLSTAGAGGPWTPVPDAPPYTLSGLRLYVVSTPIGLNGTWYRLVLTDDTGTSTTIPIVLNVLPANIVTNGTFGTGDTTGWSYFDNPGGTGEHQVTGGVFEWNRPGNSATQSVLFQVMNRPVSGTPLEAQFDLGNSANIRQRVSVLMIDSDFSDITVCTFWLAPGAPMLTYQMRTHTTKSWTNAAIYFYAATTATFAGNGGYLRLDNVSMNFNASGSDLRTECVDPTASAPGVGPDSANLLVNGDFSAGQAPWSTFGVITSQVTNGVFEYIRPSPSPATPAGVVFQTTGVAVNVDQALTATLDLGNSSAIKKRVTVLMLSGDFSDLAACTFYLPPGLPLSTYQMKMRATKAWAAGASGAALYVYAATVGSDRWIQLDNARLQFTPSATILGTECVEPVEVLKPPAFGPPGQGGQTSAPLQLLDAVPEFVSLPGGDGGSQILRSLRPIDLSGIGDGRLRFYSSVVGPSDDRGGLAVQVSRDGVTWETIAEVPPSEAWTEVEIDLSEYAGRAIYVQFVHTQAGEGAGVWRVTRVRVTRRD